MIKQPRLLRLAQLLLSPGEALLDGALILPQPGTLSLLQQIWRAGGDVDVQAINVLVVGQTLKDA